MSEPRDRHDDERHKQRQNMLVLVAVVLLLGCGLWLVDQLLEGRRMQNCIEARHRNCVPLELPPRQ